MGIGSDNQPGGVTLGETLRSAREGLRLSLRQLADSVETHHSLLARLESGEYLSTKPELLSRLARKLELDERDLFSLAGLDVPEGLPSFVPYLRAKYDMPPDAAKALQEYFGYVSEKYDVQEKRPPAA